MTDTLMRSASGCFSVPRWDLTSVYENVYRNFPQIRKSAVEILLKNDGLFLFEMYSFREIE